MSIDLDREGHVWVLHLREAENRFNRTSVDAIHAALDTIEASDGPAAMVTTGEGKFFSNGLDLDWLSQATDTGAFLADVHKMFGRVMGLPLFTVAAVNGHAFAGGAMLATAHDVVVMREDRGYWCLPEVDLGLPLTLAMYATVAAKLPRDTLRDASLRGRRYGAPEAVEAGIAQRAASESDVLPVAVALAAEMAGKDRSVIGAHKQLLYGDAIRVCMGD